MLVKSSSGYGVGRWLLDGGLARDMRRRLSPPSPNLNPHLQMRLMKQFYMLALGGLLSFTATAQKACAPANAARIQLNEVKTLAPVLDGERFIIWANTISDCTEWTTANANEPGAILDWQCGTEGPSGAYAIAGINSPTADDGFLLLDSDAAGSAVGPLENCWVDLVTPFTTVGTPSVALSFYNYFRTYLVDDEYCLLEVSRDGVTWPDVATTAEADGFVTYDEAEGPVQARWDLFQLDGGGSATANPELKLVNISDVAGDQAEVYLRFRWVGSWGYAWMVDDLEAVEIPAYDITVANYASYTDEAFTNLYEYGVWAQDQLPDTLFYGVEVLNFGDSLATNVYATVEINGASFDGPALSSLTPGSVATVNVPYATDDAVGTYDLSLTLNMDSPDDNLDNNTSSASYAVSEFQWGRDNGTIVGVNAADGSEDYIEMPLYQVLENTTIYGVDVAIMEGTEAFSEVRGFLVDALDDNALTAQYGGEVAFSDPVQLVPSNFNATDTEEIIWYTFVFEEPYEALEGELLGAAFENFGGAPVLVGRAQPVPAQTVFVYGPYGAGQVYDWYYQTSTPMVRLNLDPNAQPPVIEGCTDSGACNFNPNATVDDGLCEYESCAGCLDNAACNYDPSATLGDGSCDYGCYGCTDPLAFNYDVSATIDDGSCTYFEASCAFLGNPEWADLPLGIQSAQPLVHLFAEQVSQQVVLNAPSVIQEPTSGSFYGLLNWTDLSISGMPEGLSFEDMPASIDADNQLCLTYSGIPVDMAEFEVSVSGELFLSVFGSPYSIGTYTVPFMITVVENPNPIPGCTYPNATNYSPFSTVEDGSCVFEGCTDPEALNYQIFATVDDGSCDNSTCQSNCPSDLDGDGTTGTQDLLQFLASFGFVCLD